MKKSLAVVAAMIDDLAPVAARISKSLKSHKVVVSTDRVLDDLNTLVSEYADGKEVRASARTTDADAGAELPPYNIAADMISTAFALFEQGDTRRALQQMVVAFESEGMPELAQALVAMNDESQGDADEDHEVTAGAADDEDDNDDADAGDDDSASDDDEDDDDGSDDEDDEDDWDDPDADGDATSDAGVIEGVVSEMQEPPVMDVSDEDDEDGEDDESVLLSRFRSVSASANGKDNVALANAMSLTGMPPARRVAKHLLDEK